MGSDYENRLISFAEGKRLGRLSRVVRERGVCDACGSTLPHLLFGLRDTASGRHYFLGQNCLALLMDRGFVARARYRESAEVAYRREMELRGHATPAAAPEVPAAKHATRVQSGRASNAGAYVQSEGPARVNGLPANGPLDGLAGVPAPRPRFQWVREDSALVLHRVIEPSATDLEAFFRAAYLLARDHLLAEGDRSTPKRAGG